MAGVAGGSHYNCFFQLIEGAELLERVIILWAVAQDGTSLAVVRLEECQEKIIVWATTSALDAIVDIKATGQAPEWTAEALFGIRVEILAYFTELTCVGSTFKFVGRLTLFKAEAG